jgi:phage terminase small subunit
MAKIKALTKKEKSFVEAYCGVAKFNGAESARLSGYATKSARITAARLLTKDNIQEYIEVFMAQAKEKALCTIEDVVEGLLTEAQCNGEGSSQSARVSAWKALGDYTGGFDKSVSKIDHSSKDGSMSPAFDSGKYKDAQDKLKDLD